MTMMHTHAPPEPPERRRNVPYPFCPGQGRVETGWAVHSPPKFNVSRARWMELKVDGRGELVRKLASDAQNLAEPENSTLSLLRCVGWYRGVTRVATRVRHVLFAT